MDNVYILRVLTGKHYDTATQAITYFGGNIEEIFWSWGHQVMRCCGLFGDEVQTVDLFVRFNLPETHLMPLKQTLIRCEWSYMARGERDVDYDLLLNDPSFDICRRFNESTRSTFIGRIPPQEIAVQRKLSFPAILETRRHYKRGVETL